MSYEVKAVFYNTADKSDPLNELVVVGLKVFEGDTLLGLGHGGAQRIEASGKQRSDTDIVERAISAAVKSLLDEPFPQTQRVADAVAGKRQPMNLD